MRDNGTLGLKRPIATFETNTCKNRNSGRDAAQPRPPGCGESEGSGAIGGEQLWLGRGTRLVPELESLVWSFPKPQFPSVRLGHAPSALPFPQVSG